MPADRSLYWSIWTPSRRVPSLRELRLVCEDYTAGLGTRVVWHMPTRRFYIDLPGTSSHPLRRVARPAPYSDDGWKLWIEVWRGAVDDRWMVDVMTRWGDAVTCAIADGLVGVIERQWAGKRE